MCLLFTCLRDNATRVILRVLLSPIIHLRANCPIQTDTFSCLRLSPSPFPTPAISLTLSILSTLISTFIPISIFISISFTITVTIITITLAHRLHSLLAALIDHPPNHRAQFLASTEKWQ